MGGFEYSLIKLISFSKGNNEVLSWSPQIFASRAYFYGFHGWQKPQASSLYQVQLQQRRCFNWR
uniref:Uncharacterized protein n=1 Tax=Salix viminalis TaxID=40686 RepID=A0A6N2KQR1_SALVM